ncbi:MAG: WbuC family cupin fold metalloprotein [Prevotella sp.]|nr:WbuC family cupin fold metalloprotein [Candidatus Prevotella equi]
MKITKELFCQIAEQAAESPRLRKNFDLRNNEDEQSQRMLNVLLPGTKSLIHRHTDTIATVICLEGTCIERYYDNEGNETDCFVLSAGSNLIGLQIPAGQFHSIEVPSEWTEKAVIVEFKVGKFEPAKAEDIIEM